MFFSRLPDKESKEKKKILKRIVDWRIKWEKNEKERKHKVKNKEETTQGEEESYINEKNRNLLGRKENKILLESQ